MKWLSFPIILLIVIVLIGIVSNIGLIGIEKFIVWLFIIIIIGFAIIFALR